MEIDRRLEVVLVSESSRSVLHPLNLRIDRFARSIGDSVFQVRQEIPQPGLQRAGHLDDGLESAVGRPVVPPREMVPGGPFVGVVKQRHRRFFQRPRTCRLEVALP